MSRCDECGKQENMPYQCRHCGGTYCAEHRLPENHECPNLRHATPPKSSQTESVVTNGYRGGDGSDQSRIRSLLDRLRSLFGTKRDE